MKSAFVLQRSSAVVIALAVLAGCQVVPQNGSAPPAPEPTPAPVPVPQAPPPPPPAVPTSSQSSLHWEVAPVEAGRWTYQADGADRRALFGLAAGQERAVITCLTSSRQVAISFPNLAGVSGAITLRTTYGVLEWPTSGAANGSGALIAARPANDPGLDWIAYSRGRISVELNGQRQMVLPTASEIGRVIEDCRS